MAVLSKIHRMPGVLIALLAIAAVMVVSQPARSYVGSVPPAIDVQATPTVGLGDGTPVAVHVESKDGSVIYDLQAHLCQAGAGIKNGFEFDLDGPFCSPYPVSPAADAAVEQKSSGSAVDLTFHVGIGTGAPWNETDGGSHTLTCGPGAACDLVLQVAITGQNVFHAIPLCWGDGCGPEPTGAAPPPPPPSDTSAAPPSTTVAAAPASGDAGSGTGSPSKGAGAAAAGTAKDSGAGKGGSGSGSGSGSSSDERSQALGPSVTTASDSSPIAPWRVALAGIAGLLCGARIVSVVSRARRPRVGIA
jgi:hypothetical protein